MAGAITAVITVIFMLGIAAGINIKTERYNSIKQQCAKDNNVYECVIVAVPKEGE